VNGTKTTGLVATAVGAIFVYAGIKGFSILKAAQNVIRGTAPGTGQKASLLSTSMVSAPTSTGAGLANPKAGNWSHDGLMKLWVANGGSSARANNAACHGIQESSGDASVISHNPDGGVNVGIWQLDTKGKGAGYTVAQLQNPNTNAKVTIRESDDGRDWSAWATPGC
jgi:Lysozyme like domain